LRGTRAEGVELLMGYALSREALAEAWPYRTDCVLHPGDLPGLHTGGGASAAWSGGRGRRPSCVAVLVVEDDGVPTATAAFIGVVTPTSNYFCPYLPVAAPQEVEVIVPRRNGLDVPNATRVTAVAARPDARP
jgi:hypothetical protein